MPAIELLTIRVPSELKRWLEEEAYRRRTSMNRAMVAILHEVSLIQPSTLVDVHSAPTTKSAKKSVSLPDDDWLRDLLLDYTDWIPFDALNDNEWWIAMSQPLEGVFDRAWLNKEFGKITAYLIEKPRKQPRSAQGWKTFVRGWLQRAYEHQRKYTYG